LGSEGCLHVVDARYLSCPGPLLTLVKKLREVKPGEVIKLLATDPAAPRDVMEWAERVGHEFIRYQKVGDVFEIYIRVGAGVRRT